MKEVRIDDLREPRRTPEEEAVRSWSLALEVDMSFDTIVGEARAKTGMTRIDDETVYDRLRAQIDAVEADTGLSGIGRLVIQQRLIGLVAARLRYEDFVRRFPEALEVELEPPVIVVGLPRSGTTHLVNLLASDSRFRSMPWWEVQEPIPIWGDMPDRDGIDPRWKRSLAVHEMTMQSSPLTALMHDRPPHSIEEDCELLDLDFAGYTLEWHGRVPTWRDHYFTLDQTTHYAFLRRQLQVLSFLRGPRRWVLKTPQHLEQIPALMATFPDATIAFTLRDPVAVVQSAITMLGYADRNRRREVGLDELAGYWIERVEMLLRAALRDVHHIPAAQRVDVEFGEFMADDLAMATKILTVAGMEITDAARAQLAAYVASNPRGKDGRIVYDLRADFGIEPDSLYERYAFYLDAYPQIRREVH